MQLEQRGGVRHEVDLAPVFSSGCEELLKLALKVSRFAHKVTEHTSSLVLGALETILGAPQALECGVTGAMRTKLGC